MGVQRGKKSLTEGETSPPPPPRARPDSLRGHDCTNLYPSLYENVLRAMQPLLWRCCLTIDWPLSTLCNLCTNESLQASKKNPAKSPILLFLIKLREAIYFVQFTPLPNSQHLNQRVVLSAASRETSNKHCCNACRTSPSLSTSSLHAPSQTLTNIDQYVALKTTLSCPAT